jgi:hypothetical protein
MCALCRLCSQARVFKQICVFKQILFSRKQDFNTNLFVFRPHLMLIDWRFARAVRHDDSAVAPSAPSPLSLQKRRGMATGGIHETRMAGGAQNTCAYVRLRQASPARAALGSSQTLSLSLVSLSLSLSLSLFLSHSLCPLPLSISLSLVLSFSLSTSLSLLSRSLSLSLSLSPLALSLSQLLSLFLLNFHSPLFRAPDILNF